MDGGFDNDVLQQRLTSVAIQREEIHQLEIELRAKLIARNEIIEVQNNYESQLKNHTSAAAKLQDQIIERERRIHDLETKMEEKDKEVHEIKLANKAAWAKEDLIREQNKELANFRIERNISEAERVQHRKQLHDLQEHSQEKERQFIELQEQNKVAQETIIFKDGQLREAQSWISHIQEMDSMQSSTIHSLQSELREITEQYNQLWLAYQKQMERFHLHVVQHLQLADSQETNVITQAANSCIDDENGHNVVQFGHNNGNQPDVSEGGTFTENISSFSISSPSKEVHDSVDKPSEHHDMENCALNINCNIEEPGKTESLSTSSGPGGFLEENSNMINIATTSVLPPHSVPVIKTTPATAKTTQQVTLLDERSLLASIVRTIPPGSGGMVQISSTLPKRLGKVLAPLNWHDYQKKYGNLCDFVAVHPELFLIEGDSIQLQDGAQEIIAATSAAAKVAAAAAAASNQQLLHNVSVTPMAHFKTKDVVGTTGGNMTNIKLLRNSKKDEKMNGSEIDNKMNAKMNDSSVQYRRRRDGVNGTCKQ